MDIEYRLIRSNRRSIGIEVDREGNVTVRAPYSCEKKRIERFLLEKKELDPAEGEVSEGKCNEAAGKEGDAGSRKEILPESGKRSIRRKDRILCPENGCDLWAYFHPGAEDQMGKLQQRGESQLQLEAGADASGSSGLCCGS